MPRIDPELGTRAKRMRHEATPAEVVLWRHVSNSQLGGFKFRRQSVIAPYIVDFLCPARALIVEVDGETHDIQIDAQRTASLESRGYVVLRYTNAEVLHETEGVLISILDHLRASPARWPSTLPHPNPSPKGGRALTKPTPSPAPSSLPPARRLPAGTRYPRVPPVAGGGR
ncbi:MAG TPA: DUF559 domain-containing protein [Sphingomonadaceae bacterium]|nr:DUF559 domain-containing protein [Sphingomonadaceae bacterium]